jgi:hypothetical protein
MTGEEFEQLLCDKCLQKFAIKQEIRTEDMCPECVTTVMLLNGDIARAFFLASGISTK